jgi:hypothetical protein
MKRIIAAAVMGLALAGCSGWQPPPGWRPFQPLPMPYPVSGGAPPPPAMQIQQGASAYWTGRQEMGQSVTGMSVWRCEYNYAGQTFWRAFPGSCPSSMQVQ